MSFELEKKMLPGEKATVQDAGVENSYELGARGTHLLVLRPVGPLAPMGAHRQSYSLPAWSGQC